MSKQLTLAMTIFMLISCGKPIADTTTTSVPALIQGQLTVGKFVDTAGMLVAQTNNIVSNQELDEEAVKQHIAKVSTLLNMANKLNVEKSHLLEAELLSSLGSLYTKQSVFHSNNVKMAGSLASKGFRYLDKAVNKYPDNVTARLNRGMVSAKVPEFLNKTQVAITDLEFVMAHQAFSHLSPSLQQAVKANLAHMTERMHGNS